MAGPYAYARKVNYNREQVTEHKEKEVKLPLTAEAVRSIVGENEFWFGQDDEGPRGLTHWLLWSETRDETDEEMLARIADDEAYNVRREEYLKQEKQENGNTDKN